MKRLALAGFDLVICFCLFIATSSQAFAYVDPGSGLLALQSAASIAAASMYFLRRRIRGLFVRSAEAGKADLPAQPSDTTPAKAA
jgi:hypothetical protein